MKRNEMSLKTKIKLANSLKKELAKKPFDQITISNLVKMNNMNRKTFYYHFKDMQDLLKFALECETKSVFPDLSDALDVKEAMIKVLDYIKTNENFVANLYDVIGREGLKNLMNKQIYDISSRILSELEAKYDRQFDADKKEYITCFFTEGLAGVLIDIFQNKNGNYSEDLIDYAAETFKTCLADIVKNEKKRKR